MKNAEEMFKGIKRPKNPTADDVASVRDLIVQVCNLPDDAEFKFAILTLPSTDNGRESVAHVFSPPGRDPIDRQSAVAIASALVTMSGHDPHVFLKTVSYIANAGLHNIDALGSR